MHQSFPKTPSMAGGGSCGSGRRSRYKMDGNHNENIGQESSNEKKTAQLVPQPVSACLAAWQLDDKSKFRYSLFTLGGQSDETLNWSHGVKNHIATERPVTNITDYICPVQSAVFNISIHCRCNYISCSLCTVYIHIDINRQIDTDINIEIYIERE